MSDKTELVRGWLKMLAAFQFGKIDPDEVEWRLAVLAPALAAEFDAEAFTPDTVREVAKGCGKYFPVFGEICQLLAPLAREIRERAQWRALPPPRAESREPYDPGPAAPERPARLMGRALPGELRIQDPVRTVEEQLKALGHWPPPKPAPVPRAANTDAPLRAAAAATPAAVKRAKRRRKPDAGTRRG